jgi:hypothetical protein
MYSNEDESFKKIAVRNDCFSISRPGEAMYVLNGNDKENERACVGYQGTGATEENLLEHC